MLVPCPVKWPDEIYPFYKLNPRDIGFFYQQGRSKRIKEKSFKWVF